MNSSMRVLFARSNKSVYYGYIPICANFSTTSANLNRHYQVAIVGGGSGGIAIAAKLAKKLNPKNVAIIEPSKVHYYQPLFTFVGGGMKPLSESIRETKSLIPHGMKLFQDRVVCCSPDKKYIRIGTGEIVTFDYLVIACGMRLNYDKIKGLPEAFNTPGVCSNYSPLYVEKTYEALKNFIEGNAIFTFPNTPVKCAGAPQKILYIAEDYLRKTGKRHGANMIYNTSLDKLFGVQKYAEALWEVVKSRDIEVNFRRNLIEVIPEEKKAVFQDLDFPDNEIKLDYEMLHITPPMGAVGFLRNAAGDLCDENGFLKVNKESLQHDKYPYIFGIGDCTNVPTSKTAAAVAAQSGILFNNLLNVMNGKEVKKLYDGYTSCPLVTSYKNCIMAEFDFNMKPLETFPFDQSKERRSMFHVKKDVMPQLYWNVMMRGNWSGPAGMRKVFHPLGGNNYK